MSSFKSPKSCMGETLGIAHCSELNVCPQTAYADILPANVMVLGGRVFGK